MTTLDKRIWSANRCWVITLQTAVIVQNAYVITSHIWCALSSFPLTSSYDALWGFWVFILCCFLRWWLSGFSPLINKKINLSFSNKDNSTGKKTKNKEHSLFLYQEPLIKVYQSDLKTLCVYIKKYSREILTYIQITLGRHFYKRSFLNAFPQMKSAYLSTTYLIVKRQWTSFMLPTSHGFMWTLIFETSVLNQRKWITSQYPHWIGVTICCGTNHSEWKQRTFKQ